MSDNQWWKRGVIYQIYPRSFADSNGDGVGDLPGIVARLDYLAELGVDAVWLSPIYRSPMADFGYDVSDYREIDPLFGSASDFELLVAESHRRGIRIIMDLVLNHTSDRHPWFLQSRSSRDNPRRDWYLWRDGRRARPPNNWLASFGGRAWEWDERTGQYYLHSFMREQPDLNWRNPEVKEAVFAEVRFWLDRGVDGFRLDVINWLVKDALLRSNPPGLGPYPRPYDLQRHLYDRNRPETHLIVRELRALVEAYGERVLIGEVYAEPPGDPALSASYLGGQELHLAFDFSLSYAKWSANRFFRRIARWMEALPPSAWPCHVLSNHDQPRSASRLARGAGGSHFGGLSRLAIGVLTNSTVPAKTAFSRTNLGQEPIENAVLAAGQSLCQHSAIGGALRAAVEAETDARARVAAFFLLTLRGTPVLYYGEELGMRNGRLSRREILDPIGRRYWPVNKGRDPARTPMPWSNRANGGFTSGRPWLPMNREYREINVERESGDAGSLLTLYKRLIALRRQRRALTEGEWLPAARGRNDLIAYLRVAGSERLLVALNFARSPRRLALESSGAWRVLLSTHRAEGETGAAPLLALAPYEATIWEAL